MNPMFNIRFLVRRTRLYAGGFVLALGFFALADNSLKETSPILRTLFNGTDLTGWIPRGGNSHFEVKDGVIVGTCVEGSPSTYLCTKATYTDFILELEYRIDRQMNSGVQIRTQVASQNETFTKANGKKRVLKKGSIYGYQVELDPTERAWTGGIYDQSRRGWLQTLEGKSEARRAHKNGHWNKLRIQCRGNRIQTWINEVPAADLRDDSDRKGVIGLQIHGAGRHKDRIGASARFRNIRISEL